MSRLTSLMLSVAATAALSACGGGSSDSPSPAPAGVTLSGVAASGDALAGATVEARCRGGSTGSAVTTATGSYTLTLATGSLPCVLRATSAGGGATVLHSVAQASGTANITPPTQLVVASLAGISPVLYFTSFNDTLAASITSASLQAAHARVVDILGKGGADFSAFGNLFTATLVAANGGTTGNAYDQALDALMQRIADRGLTLAGLTDAVVRASPANTTPTTNVPSLPPQALLQPASATCSALRSGLYRVIVPQIMPAGEYSTGTISFDAGTGVLTDEDGPNQLTSTGNCTYTSAQGGELVVSQAGVIVIRAVEAGGTRRLGLAFPEQAHAVADLAGAWQTLGFERNDGGSYTANSAIATVAASGTISGITICQPVETCAPLPGVTLGLTSNASGGFDLANGPGNGSDRLFAYRAGNGDLMLVDLAGNGSFGIWTQQRTLTLSAVGSRARSWGMWNNPNQVSTAAISTSDFTTTAVDTATGSWTRVAEGDGHPETIVANQPRAGWLHRVAATAPTNSGGTVSVLEFHLLSLRGMGISALSIPQLGGGAYFVSVTQP